MNLSGPGLFLGGRFLIASSTSDLVIGLFRVSTSSWFKIGKMQMSRNLSTYPGLLAYVHRIVYNNLF